jgi:hypothetical protein
MRSERFRWLTTAGGPFASVYFDDSHDTSDAVEQLEARWRAIRTELENLGAEAELVARLKDAVLHSRPAVGRRGRALIATREHVLVNEHLTSPPPATVVRLSDYPYIFPLIALGMRQPMYMFAAVDHSGADVTLYQGGVISSKSIDGGGYPVDKPVTARWGGYGDFRHNADKAIRMNCRAVADELTRLADEADPEVVFVSGEEHARTEVVSALPPRVAERVPQKHAGARKRGIDEEAISDRTAAEFAGRRCAETTEVAERFEAEVGRGSVVGGRRTRDIVSSVA